MTAAYCREGDALTYYEIDRRILRLAQSEFSYLSRCPQAEVRIGDARVLLEKEKREGTTGRYDVIAIDAFNDDTIPVHLITREAIDLYRAHLSGEDGVIAVHISNRYLDLRPPLLAIAAELGLSVIFVETVSESEVASGSAWVLLFDGSLQRKEFADAASHPHQSCPRLDRRLPDISRSRTVGFKAARGAEAPRPPNRFQYFGAKIMDRLIVKSIFLLKNLSTLPRRQAPPALRRGPNPVSQHYEPTSAHATIPPD